MKTKKIKLSGDDFSENRNEIFHFLEVNELDLFHGGNSYTKYTKTTPSAPYPDVPYAKAYPNNAYPDMVYTAYADLANF